MTHPRTVSRLAVCTVAAVLLLGACGKSGQANQGAKGKVAADDPSVKITNFQFSPATLNVKPGTKVTWTNDDTATHSIKDTSPLATPVSQDLVGKGATFSIIYERPGSYSYICGIHQYMTGTVTVAP
jgi:plastocyanin